MFTGIIECTSSVLQVNPVVSGRLVRISVARPIGFDDIHPGDSIAVNGVCLTVEDQNLSSGQIQFALAEETLDITALAGLSVGESVNLERSAQVGSRVHGHNVLGHVDGVCTVKSFSDLPDRMGRNLTVLLGVSYKKYLWKKASWALSGVSLTINEVREVGDQLEVDHCLIPETLKRTNLGQVRIHDRLNFEVDNMNKAIYRAIESYMESRK